MKRQRLPHILALLLLICLACRAQADPMSLEVIQLHHRSVDEVIPILQPLLPQGGTLTGTGYQLIVRTTPENLEQLRDVLQRIDTAPKRLLITVRQSADDLGSQSDVAVSGRIGTGARISTSDSGHGGTRIEYRDGDTRVRTRVRSTATRGTANADQQLQVLEGHEALIQLGESVPVLERSVTTSGGQAVVQDQIAYKDVLRGFYVLPRINGEQVILDVSPYSDTMSQTQGGAVNVQRLHTTVSGRLGEWLEIGGTVEEASQSDNAYTRSARTASREQRRVWVRVEEMGE